MLKYFKELNLLLLYVIFNFLFNLIVSFFKLPSIILFLSYYGLKIFKKKLLILQILELLQSSILISFNVSIFFSLFFFHYFFLNFFYPSWYNSQFIFIINFYRNFLKICFFSLIIINMSSYLLLLFSLIWNFNNFFLFFDTQFQLIKLVTLQINLLFSIFFTISLFFSFISFLKIFFNWLFLLKKFKILKKFITLTISILLWIICYDFFSQFMIIILILFINEVIFFYICLKTIE